MTSSSGLPGGGTSWELMAHLWQFFQTITDEAAPALEAIGLTPKAFFLLSTVETHPFPAELARLMHLPPPTVTYLIKVMESKGFLDRRAEPGDLRKFRLIVTEAGRAAIVSGQEALGAAMSGRLSRLGPEEIREFDRVMARLA